MIAPSRTTHDGTPERDLAEDCGRRRCACRVADGLVLATAGEVAVSCGNRFPGAATSQIRRWLAGRELTVTRDAARLIGFGRLGRDVDAVAGLVAARKLVLLDGQLPMPRMNVPPLTRRSTENPLPPNHETRTTWIRIRVVHHRTGEPFEGVLLRVATANGAVYPCETRGDGIAEVHDIQPGPCAVDGSIEDARLQRTLGFVAMGETPGGPFGDAAGGGDILHLPRCHDQWRWIAVVERRKVGSGDTLDSIAASAGMTAGQLALFNWGVASPSDTNKALREWVGCTRTTPDGRNYLLDDTDVPGIIFLPRPWRIDGLATGTTHTVRVDIAAGFRLLLHNQDGLHIPEAAYRVTFADGAVQSGRLGRSGLALVDDPAPGPVEVVYEEHDDIEAKSLAACARRAFANRDLNEVFRMLKHSRWMVRRAIEMYDTYYNDHSGQGFLVDLDLEAPDPADRVTLDTLLRIAQVHADRQGGAGDEGGPAEGGAADGGAASDGDDESGPAVTPGDEVAAGAEVDA